MTDMDRAIVADVVDLMKIYHNALGLDASTAEQTAAVQAHLLMEQNRHLAEISDKLSAISRGDVNPATRTGLDTS